MSNPKISIVIPAYTEAERLTLIFDEADRVESDPRGERRMAWLDFLPEL